MRRPAFLEPESDAGRRTNAAGQCEAIVRDQVSFHGRHHERYVLARYPSLEPLWPPSARFERVDAIASARILRQFIDHETGSAKGRLLDLLGIHQHPSNLCRRALLARLNAALGITARRFTLYRELREAPPRMRSDDRKPPPSASETSAPALDFFALELEDEDGNTVPSMTIVVALTDGDHRTLLTDASGKVLVEHIPPGSCAVKLHTRVAAVDA